MTAWFLKSLLALCVLGIVAHAEPANAKDYRIGSLRIDHPWAIATPSGAKVGAGYLKITNEGTQPDRLVALTSPAARKVAAHASVKEGDVIKMRLLEQGVEIKPGETAELNPEGMHIMFEGLNAPLVAGARVKATLTFEKAGSIEVEYTVEPLGTKASGRAPAAQSHTH
jgi:periplasmic copper chaperone A